MSAPALAELLAATRGRLLAFVRAEAGVLLRHETEDDLVQGVHAHAISVSERFAWRGEREFLNWLFTLARQHFADRLRHHRALRRDAGQLLRLTSGSRGSVSSSPVAAAPKAKGAGPSTFAARREQLLLAQKALKLLSERDRLLVQWMSDDVPLEEVGRRLGASYEAAKRARQRALERFRATFELIAGDG